jgi:CRP/FNR family cyclic AMP-dependent transcriptional regulator
LSHDGRQVVIGIYQTDDFFGESAFLGAANRAELAVALEGTRVMTWTTAEIEAISMKRPKLAIAMMQLLVHRSVDFTQRIESFSVDTIARRLARTLLQYSERLGTRQDDGSVQMNAFTHELLSQCVGTSREIVTHTMNHFRRQGFLRYSREKISLYPAALKDWLSPRVVFHDGALQHGRRSDLD